jgi:hypothetical protein
MSRTQRLVAVTPVFWLRDTCMRVFGKASLGMMDKMRTMVWAYDFWRPRRQRVACLAAILLVLGLVSRANALIRGPLPPSLRTHTVEALTAESPLILTATFRSDRMTSYDWQGTFATGEILKSPPGYAAAATLDAHLDFFFTSFHFVPGDEHRFQFPPSGARVLLFLREDNRVNDCVLLDAAGPARSMLAPRVLDLSLVNMADNQSILSKVQAELHRVPPTTTAKSYFVYPLSPDSLPNDDRLLPAARQWVRSGDSFARLIGARVLEQFPDPQDTESLKSLLDDPFLTDYPMLSPWSGRTYLVRLAAWQALKAGGTPLPPPVVQTPRPGMYRSVSWLWPVLFLAGPWILCAAWYIRTKRRGQTPPRFRRYLANCLSAICLVYAAASLPPWWRSTRTADDMVWARGGLMFNLSSIQGNLYFVGASSWPATTPLVGAAITPDRGERDLVKRSDRFWHGLGTWGMDDSLWSTYVWSPHYVPRMIYAGTIEDRFPFPLPRPSPYPPSRGMVVVCSYLYLILILLSFPVVRLIVNIALRIRRARQAAHAARRGLCPKCSYDLRAHKPGERCPECGTVIDSTHSPTASQQGPFMPPF